MVPQRQCRAFGPRRRLTLFGRSALLLSAELLANALCWFVAGILFGRHRDTQRILSLALLAWTIGLRHGFSPWKDDLLKDRSAIDNATRGLISLGQLPVTCGLFFSLGHSTIVILVNVAIAISTDVADKIGGVGDVGGIVGSAVSATFLFIVGLANSIILYRILRKRRRNRRRREERVARGEDPDGGAEDAEDEGRYNTTIMMRVLGPVVRFVDRPWKMYPVGVLFGFGFDTASSIALLAASALAKKGANGQGIPPADIVVLPLLFTAGMTLLDSLDSVLMLYSYAGFPERSFALVEAAAGASHAEGAVAADGPLVDVAVPQGVLEVEPDSPAITLPARPAAIEASAPKGPTPRVGVKTVEAGARAESERRVKRNVMSGLSVVLTFMSIVVAFSISLITIMGLIGDNCARCKDAADAADGGGLAGRWWRLWAEANDKSGYIGAAIVGSFVAVVCAWYGGRWAWRKERRRQRGHDARPEQAMAAEELRRDA